MLATAGLAGQNLIQHYAGTGFASRGSISTVPVTLLQRLPEDQVRGRTAVHSLVYAVQNDTPTGGLATWAVEVRRNDTAVATGAPDMAAAGAIATLPVALSIAGGRVAYLVTTTPATPILLPPTSGVPAGDIYVGIALPAPTTAINLTLHMAMDLNARPAAVGYTGVPGVIGLAWEAPGHTSPRLMVPSGGIAWNVGTLLVDETLQPFVEGTPFFQPHFGYGALFPDSARHDRFGLRTIAQGGGLDVSVLILGPPVSPIPIPGIGSLAVLPFFAVEASLFRPQGQGTVAATFGPYPLLPGPGDLHLQALSYKFGGGHRLSTSCKIDF